MKRGHPNRNDNLQDQILSRTIALDPKFNDLFVHTHKKCKCGGDIMKGSDACGYAMNYRECIKCGKWHMEKTKVWNRRRSNIMSERKR